MSGSAYHFAIESQITPFVYSEIRVWLEALQSEELLIPLPGDPEPDAKFYLCGKLGDDRNERSFEWIPRGVRFAEQTYYGYRLKSEALMESHELARHLESRYRCQALEFAGRLFPATVLWSAETQLISPDSLLGDFDDNFPGEINESPTMSPSDYAQARAYIKGKLEAGPIKYEGVDYRMTRIDLNGRIPRVHGGYGRYYDAILTQYAMEWELRRALALATGRDAVATLSKPGTLPLREAVEATRNPVLDGRGRCAALSVSTLFVFSRENHFYSLLRRRSAEVSVSPRMFHVVPSGMFEMRDRDERWSIEMNIWRELLEEVYDEKQEQGTGSPEIMDYIKAKPPIGTLIKMIGDGSAELGVTGICCDLLMLRPEICTVLFVPDPAFLREKQINLNWEYENLDMSERFAMRWDRVDELIRTEIETGGIVASGAVCLGLGREWIRRRHNI